MEVLTAISRTELAIRSRGQVKHPCVEAGLICAQEDPLRLRRLWLPPDDGGAKSKRRPPLWLAAHALARGLHATSKL